MRLLLIMPTTFLSVPVAYDSANMTSHLGQDRAMPFIDIRADLVVPAQIRYRMICTISKRI